MSVYFALFTVENDKNKKSAKFQGDMLNFYDLFRFLYLPQITILRSCSPYMGFWHGKITQELHRLVSFKFHDYIPLVQEIFDTRI